jgi:hypothetical protein
VGKPEKTMTNKEENPTIGNRHICNDTRKEGLVQVHWLITDLIPACLLFLAVALTATPAFTAPRSEALSKVDPIVKTTTWAK